MNNIIANNIHFSYTSDKQVLKGLNFTVGSNEIVGLLGANGSGKTTTFKLMSGLLYPDEGTISIAGLSVQDDIKEVQKITAYLPDESLLYPNYSALENLNLFALLWGVEKKAAKERATKLLKEVGLWKVRNQWVKSYSRGMKQKLSLCAALLHEPQIMFMDEPFSGLDINALVWAREMFKEYVQKENRSIIFTSHTPEVIESLATRVLILKNGVIIHDESIEGTEDGMSLIETYKNLVPPQTMEV